MSRRNARFYRYEFGKQGPRPRDIDRVSQHISRRRAKAALRTYRYLRAPQLYLADFAAGVATGFCVLALVMTIAGLLV